MEDIFLHGKLPKAATSLNPHDNEIMRPLTETISFKSSLFIEMEEVL